MKRRPPAAQPTFDIGAAASTVATPAQARATSDGPPFGPLPRKLGDLFLCSGCQKLVAATEHGRMTAIVMGNLPSSYRVVWLACSKRCANKANFCGSCEVFGHERNDGPDVCPRYYSGRRMRALKLYRCFAHTLVHDYKLAAEGKSSFWTRSPSETVGKLLVEHDGDFAKVRAAVESCNSDRLMLVMERVERNDPWWNAEEHIPTATELRDKAINSVNAHRGWFGRVAPQLGYMPLDESRTILTEAPGAPLPPLVTVARRKTLRERAFEAFGARASTEEAERVLIPFLSSEDSSERSKAAWALFSHRTPLVRAAMLARSEVEDVPLLKAYLEALAGEP